MSKRTLIVAGSMNMDVVSRVARFPRSGETVHGSEVHYLPGGKGANQAVAAAQSGALTCMIGAVGTDGFGQQLLDALKLKQVDVTEVSVKDGASGIALIAVSDAGENQIVLCAGANGKVADVEIDALDRLLTEAGAIVLQNEIPWASNAAFMRKASDASVPVIYNPAPAGQLEVDVLPLIDTIILNETETELITGKMPQDETSLEEAAAWFLTRGTRAVIITLGAEGSFYRDAEGISCRVPARQVQPVDTTAAGDTFIGAYAAIRYGGAAGDASPQTALQYATAAAALSVMKLGAQASIPNRTEVFAFMSDTN
ncbi:ribokinase [Paenibacillus cellulosilyticus]|uniref:Ribokinase n=1 Tax=Paenibacillus cellulosilyticus TaxID=375489 RepID=A0A2V2YHJ8_9BACL|nr:ribokinase [Paenibacillus cellulosilyticus]PWV92060.1 ribokinase [Paenibacillus cellulosilyticus]QKS46741.1 ribokinase [Paenibacillus cellulosilyticus]